MANEEYLMQASEDALNRRRNATVSCSLHRRHGLQTEYMDICRMMYNGRTIKCEYNVGVLGLLYSA